jgi:hypothetical protein
VGGRNENRQNLLLSRAVSQFGWGCVRGVYITFQKPETVNWGSLAVFIGSWSLFLWIAGRRFNVKAELSNFSVMQGFVALGDDLSIVDLFGFYVILNTLAPHYE